jgi:hypothetical protein
MAIITFIRGNVTERKLKKGTGTFTFYTVHKGYLFLTPVVFFASTHHQIIKPQYLIKPETANPILTLFVSAQIIGLL